MGIRTIQRIRLTFENVCYFFSLLFIFNCDSCMIHVIDDFIVRGSVSCSGTSGQKNRMIIFSRYFVVFGRLYRYTNSISI